MDYIVLTVSATVAVVSSAALVLKGIQDLTEIIHQQNEENMKQHNKLMQKQLSDIDQTADIVPYPPSSN